MSPSGMEAKLLYTSSIYSSPSPWNCVRCAISLSVVLLFISRYKSLTDFPIRVLPKRFNISGIPPGMALPIASPMPGKALNTISDWFSRKRDVADLNADSAKPFRFSRFLYTAFPFSSKSIFTSPRIRSCVSLATPARPVLPVMAAAAAASPASLAPAKEAFLAAPRTEARPKRLAP